eukprot:jgi/Ulvmu1/8035/UM004_0272.1
MLASVLLGGAVFLLTIAISIDLEILQIPLYVPHATNPVGPFTPLPAVNYSGDYTVTIPLTEANTARLLTGVITGPEHLVYRSAAVAAGEAQTLLNEAQLPGHMWISSANGTVFRVAVSPDAALGVDTVEEVVYAGPGRVLGFAFDGTGGLYMCNSLQGLMHWTQDSGLKIVANRISASSKLMPGRPILYANSVIVSPITGKVYFTSSGNIPPPYNRGEYDTKAASGMIALTNQREGTVLELDPETGEVTCLVNGLYFANGVDISPDGAYLMFAETFTNKVFKLALSGPEKGTVQDVIGPLPAFVDNIMRVYGTQDSYFIGFPAAPSNLLTTPLSKSRVLRTVFSYVPDSIRYMLAPKVGGGVLFSASGQIEDMVVDVEGKWVSSTPSGIVLSSQGKRLLFMGSLESSYINVAQLPV